MANKLEKHQETEDGKDNTMKPLAMKVSGDNQKIINSLATLLCKTCPTNWEKVMSEKPYSQNITIFIDYH